MRETLQTPFQECSAIQTVIFPLYAEIKNPFLVKVVTVLGVTPSDFNTFDVFIRRVLDIITLSHERNCLLYVDAEQSYMQELLIQTLTSLGQHLQVHALQRGDFEDLSERGPEVVACRFDLVLHVCFRMCFK